MSRLFNGTSDYLAGASNPITGFTAGSGFTVSSWCKPSSFSHNAVTVSYGGSAVGDYWCIFSNTSGDGSLERCFSSASDSTYTTAALTSGSWNHLAAVVASTTSGIVYVNGNAGPTDTTSQPMVSMNEFDVGVLDDDGTLVDYYAGRIGEVAVWTTALTGTQITALATGTNPTDILPGSLKAYWQIKGVSSPEPYYSTYGTFNLTLHGTTAEVGDDPPVRPPGFRQTPPVFPQAMWRSAYR